MYPSFAQQLCSCVTLLCVAGDVTDISQWLSALGPAYSIYESAFIANGVDVSLLPSLVESDMTELGVTSVHRKKMMQSIQRVSLGNITTKHMINIRSSRNYVCRILRSCDLLDD